MSRPRALGDLDASVSRDDDVPIRRTDVHCAASKRIACLGEFDAELRAWAENFGKIGEAAQVLYEHDSGRKVPRKAPKQTSRGKQPTRGERDDDHMRRFLRRGGVLATCDFALFDT